MTDEKKTEDLSQDELNGITGGGFTGGARVTTGDMNSDGIAILTTNFKSDVDSAKASGDIIIKGKKILQN